MEYNTILVTDCGSTTTKALLFQHKQGVWHLVCRGEAPTTVEDPIADVTVGTLNAFREIEELSGRKILSTDSKQPFLPGSENQGIDLYLSTSSAGGGLQMLVAGLVGDITAASAARAALGAGAIVLDSISLDDGREEYKRIEDIRHLKPDIFLLAGGLDNGATEQIVELAETLLSANPRTRFGETLKLPVIFAGNQEIAEEIRRILKNIADIKVVKNVRPEFETENLTNAREAIHDLFLEHVMSHSPGYDKLLSWTPVPVMPTPAAVGNVIQTYAEDSKQNLLAVDIGGATTDVFSVFQHQGKYIFNRTVSANLGMSYSVANVLKETGIENIARWLPDADLKDFKNRLRNKMLRPTSIPQTKDDLMLEQAVCREALRLSLLHHRELAVGIDSTKEKSIANIFSQSTAKFELVNLLELDLVIGSGGVLSHAPERLQAAMMMLDGFALQGFTHIAVDSIFMLPHLGVLASVNPEAAKEIFLKDCLISLAHSVVPVMPKNISQKCLAKVELGNKVYDLIRDKLEVIDLTAGEKYSIKIIPQSKKINLGQGQGRGYSKDFIAGECGLILDGRVK